APNLLLASGGADAGDHTRMVERVGENHAAGQYFREGRKRRFVRDVAGGEEKSRLLSMEIGKLVFELDMIVRVTTDIARATRSGADIVQGSFHGGNDLGMLHHGKIVIGAPDPDRLGSIMTCKAARIG